MLAPFTSGWVPTESEVEPLIIDKGAESGEYERRCDPADRDDELGT